MLQVIMRLARVTAVQLCHNSLEQRLQILQARLRAEGSVCGQQLLSGYASELFPQPMFT